MSTFRIAVLVSVLLVLSGCGDDDPSSLDIVLSFRASIGAEPANCSTVYDALGSAPANVQLADARLFLSELEVRDAAGAWVSVDLDETAWQYDGVSLLDFEDGSGACADSGTAETNAIITGVVPDGDYDAVRFRVGMPFELNHINNAIAPAPFNVPGMFWTWQGGYKFLRVDWLVDGGAVPRWNVHLGSTGCVSDAPTQAPGEPCARPNGPQIEIDGMDFDLDTINMDLVALMAGADLSANSTDTPPGCMSSPAEPGDCTHVFAALGMSFDDGVCVDSCGGQTTFSIMR